MLLRLLCVVAALTFALPAQKEGEDDRGAARRERNKIRAAHTADPGDKGDEEASERERKEEWEKLTPEERLQRSTTHGAGAYCRFVAAFKPAKLMPGQSGVMVVTAVLQGLAVLPAPAPLEVISAAQQGSVSLGAPAFLEAEPGKLAKGYLGRPVYDNTATFEIPVRMAADARLGDKQPVSVDMRFDLYDGNTAMAVGRFIDRATATVEVGQVLDPVVTGLPAASAPKAAAPAGVPAGAEAVRGGGDTVPVTTATPTGVAGVAPLAVTSGEDPVAAARTPVPAAGAPLHDAEGAIPMPFLVGGGVLVLGVLGLLVLRARK